MANDEFISNLASLQAICNVSEERANELLEASNGSMERAVEIFFHQKCTEDKKSPRKVPTNKKRPTPQKPTCKDSNNTRTKQAKLHSFFHRNQSITPKKIASVSQPELISIDDSPEQAKRVSNVAKHPNVLKLPQTTDKKRSIEQKSLQSSIQFKAEVSFERLSSTLQEMADTTKRTIKLDVLKSFILDFVFHAGEMEKAFGLTCALYLVLGKSANEPLDVSHGACSKAIQSMFGVKRSQLSSANRQHGDLGDSAASFFLQKKFFGNPVGLSVIQVYSLLQKIVDADGRDAKQHILLKLMRSCQTKSELRFLVRLIIGNMRVGANLKTVLAALAMAICSIREEETMDTKSAIDLVQTTHDVCPDLEKIIRALLEGGFKQLEKDCDIQVLTPIAPMLAHPTHSLEQVEKAMLEKKSSVALEWKYDGVRCQAHYNGSTSKLFSRHMLESTAQYPDAIEAILGARKRGKAIHSFILDAEIVGVETEGNQTRLLPFQDLSKRKKKNDDGEGVSVRVFVFDLMFLNGQSCVNRPLWERRELLRDHFEETSDFAFVKSQILSTYDEDVIKAFLEEAVQRGTEGLMVKILGKHIDVSSPLPNEISTYEAGTRSHSWLKVKRDYVAGYADTIDVVPIGAWYGSGRKAKKSFLSPVLLAVYDEEEDVYRSISRCMTFTDAMYEATREFYFRGTPYPTDLDSKAAAKTSSSESHTIEEEESEEEDDHLMIDGDKTETDQEDRVHCFANRPSSAFVVTNENPPIWLKPTEVWEVSFADMTLSNKHTAAAGMVDESERGAALRFPRFKRRRPDKTPAEATTSVQIAQLFASQSKQHGSRGGKRA